MWVLDRIRNFIRKAQVPRKVPSATASNPKPRILTWTGSGRCITCGGMEFEVRQMIHSYIIRCAKCHRVIRKVQTDGLGRSELPSGVVPRAGDDH